MIGDRRTSKIGRRKTTKAVRRSPNPVRPRPFPWTPAHCLVSGTSDGGGRPRTPAVVGPGDVEGDHTSIPLSSRGQTRCEKQEDWKCSRTPTVQTVDSSRSDRAEGNSEDLLLLVEIPFLHFYNLVNKNSSQILTDYNPVYVSLFRELEHRGGARLLLLVGVDDTVILTYDNEPTSIISHALASTNYHFQICDTCSKAKDGSGPFTRLSFFDVGNVHLLKSIDEESLRNIWLEEYNNLSKSSSKNFLSANPLAYSKHARVSFSEVGSLGKVKYTVTCYYAKQFDSLR
ncbi:1-phosphatidylinositol-3-phosphate 5-kinase FAB1B [Platanthera zijinensis]|uniref:1-phosphatidylinositol-3-phosphate 5-kinase FAB1B n=1 Tax=Platanthera zijinensis TaxID=2320716 RepID=A0AAP0G4N1_9ASPA